MVSDWAVFGTVVLAHALAVASPGPDFAMVLRQSLQRGRSAGLWTAAGIGSGIVLHVSYGLFGLAWLKQALPQVLALIGVAGAAFLIVIGLSALRAQPHSSTAATAPPPVQGGHTRDFWIGFLTNALNPKAMLFFVALFSVVVAGTDSLAVKVAMGLWLPVATFGWFALVAILLSQATLRNRLLAHAHWIDRGMGVVLIALGVGALLHEAARWN